MRTAARLLPLLAGIFLLTATELRAQTQAPGPYFCKTRDFGKRIGYVSPIFNLAPADLMKVNPAWKQLMTSQYGITALPDQPCQGPYPSSAFADTMRRQFIDNLQNTMKQKVVEVSWTYGGAPPITVAPGPPPPPPPPAPPPATLTAASRQAAQAGVTPSKNYCTQNFRGLFDCEKFAQAVLQHRLAHPEEWLTDRDGTRWVSDHDLNVGIQHKLACGDCADDAMLTAWARKSIVDEFRETVMSHLMTQAQADKYADCVAKGFDTKFRADPFIHRIQQEMNEARIACGNPRG